jgi:hypothetical protein
MSEKQLHAPSAEPMLARIDRWNLVLGGILIVTCALVFDRSVLVGAAVGAVLSTVNFWAMHTLLRRSMHAIGGRRALLQFLVVMKMGLFMGLIFLAMRTLDMNPAAFAVGISIFLISIAIESLRFALGQKAPDGRA